MKRQLVATGLVLCLLASRVPAEESRPLTVEERLQQLENEVKSLRQENQTFRQQLGLDGKTAPVFVKPAGKEVALALGGLLQGQADFGAKGDSRFKTDNTRFYVRRARVNATGRFLEDFDFRIELDLAGTLSETASLRAQMTDGFINWNHFEFANVKVGQFKTPFGFEQLYADPKLLTIERSLANDSLTMGREIGVQIGGSLLDKRLTYASGVFNGTVLNSSYNDNRQFTLVERVAGVPWRGKLCGQDVVWNVGVNYYYSDDAAVTNTSAELGFTSNQFAGIRHGAGADTQLRLGRFDFWAEYIWTRFHPDNGVPASTFDAAGWYAQGAYFIFAEKLQALVKFESFDPRQGVDGHHTDAWTFGLNYYIKGEDLKLQVNYVLFADATAQPDNQSKVLLRLQAMF